MNIEAALAGLLAGIEARPDRERARESAAHAVGKLFMLAGEYTEVEEFFLRLAIKLEEGHNNG